MHLRLIGIVFLALSAATAACSSSEESLGDQRSEVNARPGEKDGTCGGTTGVRCGPGLWCQVTDVAPDAAGHCELELGANGEVEIHRKGKVTQTRGGRQSPNMNADCSLDITTYHDGPEEPPRVFVFALGDLSAGQKSSIGWQNMEIDSHEQSYSRGSAGGSYIGSDGKAAVTVSWDLGKKTAEYREKFGLFRRTGAEFTCTFE
jgi:hypothetical protein